MSKGNVNKIILLGNIGHDPELRYTAKGNPVLTLSVATNRDYKSAEGEQRHETHWHKATVWGKRAETCAKYLVKGSRIYLEGELQMKNWTDKDGNPRKTAEILVDDLRFLGGTRRELTGSPAEHLEVPALAQ
jgi:single-strand DNA-binding protein